LQATINVTGSVSASASITTRLIFVFMFMLLSLNRALPLGSLPVNATDNQGELWSRITSHPGGWKQKRETKRRLANLWRGTKITKKARAGRGQKPNHRPLGSATVQVAPVGVLPTEPLSFQDHALAGRNHDRRRFLEPPERHGRPTSRKAPLALERRSFQKHSETTN
jgi:hypothetical protein